ncbi:MAG: cupin domain-containing protein, partial [Candidatus Sulfotelmatobacter sp.]
MKTLLVFLLLSLNLLAQDRKIDRKIDPTWLHRYVPQLNETRADLASPTCHFKAIFGKGDADDRTLQSVDRFAEVTLNAHGNCQTVLYDRVEEIYFVLQGKTDLHYGNQTYAMRPNDFTYLAPGLKHSIANSSDQPAQVLVMSFKVPERISINTPSPQPKIVNLDNVKEETVEGHPTSVLYKLLLGPRNGKRDAIDDAYVVTSFFWMNFAPGGTNFPHHHETAEEIYLVLDGDGEMVAGSGMDGIA